LRYTLVLASYMLPLTVVAEDVVVEIAPFTAEKDGRAEASSRNKQKPHIPLFRLNTLDENPGNEYSFMTPFHVQFKAFRTGKAANLRRRLASADIPFSFSL